LNFDEYFFELNGVVTAALFPEIFKIDKLQGAPS